MNRATKLLNLVEEFNPVDTDSAVEKLKSGIKAPFTNIYKSSLGGLEHTAIMIIVSLDKKEDWRNGILQNSRYFMMRYDNSGELEMFSGGRGFTGKFRKARVKSVEDAIAKINKYIETQGEAK